MLRTARNIHSRLIASQADVARLPSDRLDTSQAGPRHLCLGMSSLLWHRISLLMSVCD